MVGGREEDWAEVIKDVVYMGFFFFNDTATTEIYTLSLHDALPIWSEPRGPPGPRAPPRFRHTARHGDRRDPRRRTGGRSEEHTSELQSPCNLVCRLLLEKKKKDKKIFLTQL